MKFTTESVITGAKYYNNTVDGVQYNFTKVFVMTDLADQSGIGAATVEYKWGTADNIKNRASPISVYSKSRNGNCDNW